MVLQALLTKCDPCDNRDKSLRAPLFEHVVAVKHSSKRVLATIGDH